MDVVYSLGFFTLFAVFSAANCANETNGTAMDLECPRLYLPFYGVLVYNGSWIGGDEQPAWQVNDTATFLCDRGYELVGSSGQTLGSEWNVTCEGNGTWSEDPEQYRCSRVDCGQPPPVANGSVSLSTPNATDLFSTALYTCDTGYQLSGDSGSVCWWDGVWRPDKTCIPIITVDCGDPPLISNGAHTRTSGSSAPVGTTVSYACDSGYDRDGAREIACTASGIWTEPPNCSATAVLSNIEIYIIEGAGAGTIIILLVLALTCVCCFICRRRMKQRRYIEDEEALANSGAFTLSNPLVAVKDEDAAGNPLYLTPDELNEFEQQQ